MTKLSCVLLAVVLPLAADGQITRVPDVLPAPATKALGDSLKAAEPHTRHVWRDTAPINGDGTINAYVEISRGDRRK